jgi:hypothetical protein
VSLRFNEEVGLPSRIPFESETSADILPVDGEGKARALLLSVTSGLHTFRLGPVAMPAWAAELHLEPVN